MKPITNNDHIIRNGDMSGNLESIALLIENADSYSIEFNISSAAALSGTLDVQASNSGVNFGSISGLINVTGDDTIILNVEQHAYRYVKVIYTASAGSGLLNVYYADKRGS